MGPEKVRFSGSDSELETRVVPGSDPEMDSDSDDADDAVGVGYVSLSQEPYGEGETEATDINETLREMRLYLPPPPPPEIDINAEAENEIHLQSIHMDEEHVELVKRTMASVRLPQRATPTWAHEFTDDQWQAMINKIIQGRSSPN